MPIKMPKEKVRWRWLIALLVLIGAWSLQFPATGSTENGISLTDRHDRIPLNHAVQYTIAPDDGLGLDDILNRAQWTRHASTNPVSLGFTSDGVWLKTELQLGNSDVSPRYVAVPYPLLEQVTIFIVEHSPIDNERSDSAFIVTELSSPLLPTHKHVFNLPDNLQDNLSLLVHAASTTSLQVPLELWSEHYFYQRQVSETLLWGLYFGTLLALFAYNLFLFYSVRDNAYFYYVFYLGSIFGLTLGISGFGKLYVWGSASNFTQMALPLFAGISSLCGILFARSFLAWEGQKVPLEKALSLLGMASIAVIMVGFVRPGLGANVSAWLSSLVLTCIIASALLALRNGVVIARYFLLAWTCFALGASFYLLNIFGLIPVSQFSNYSLQVGSAMEVVLLSLALAHRIKVERQQKMTALEQQHKAERQVKEMRLRALENAMHDRSTGMPNDSLLLTRMRELAEVPEAQQKPFYLVMINFPQLKDIAATLGRSLSLDLFRKIVEDFNHDARSDTCNVCIEPVKNSYVAVTDIGNIALLYDGSLTEHSVAHHLRERLRKFEKAVAMGPLSLVLDAFSGIAHCPRHGSRADQLFQQALLARDAGFQLNRRINFYNSDIDDAGRRKLALQGALTQAINREELELYLQPQFGCNGLDLVGAEILLRWQSKDYGMVPPQEFIDIAEQAGLMNKLTQFVVHKSLLLLKDLQQLGMRLSISINLSVQNLMEPEFAEFVISAAHCHAIQLKDIILEVTETAMSKNMESVIKNLQRLSDYGAHIALDDFGTGYSSLTYLSRLPIHELKIDKSFIMQMANSESDLRIVENTIKLARALRLETVAEGVEDQDALNTITRLGCHRVQGYHTGRPMNVANFKAWALTRLAG
jgi:EAL domain-containing protein (putative c-di-GMP-specific phosphodiesterase class I)/GGDEF domain-containing protein